MERPDRDAAKARVRAKLAERKQMPAREELLNLLRATKTERDALALLERFERETKDSRLSAVMDICDEVERDGMEYVSVRQIHRAALGDKPKPTFPGGGS